MQYMQHSCRSFPLLDVQQGTAQETNVGDIVLTTKYQHGTARFMWAGPKYIQVPFVLLQTNVVSLET